MRGKKEKHSAHLKHQKCDFSAVITNSDLF